MVPYVGLTALDIIRQRNIGPCVNFNKDGHGGGMVCCRQDVIRCLDTQPLPSEAAVKHDYNVPQVDAVVELQNAIVVFNTRERSQHYKDQWHQNGWPFEYTFGGKYKQREGDTRKFKTNKDIHLFVRDSGRHPFTYTGRIRPLSTDPVYIQMQNQTNPTDPTPTWRFVMLDIPNPPPQAFTNLLQVVFDPALPGF